MEDDLNKFAEWLYRQGYLPLRDGERPYADLVSQYLEESE